MANVFVIADLCSNLFPFGEIRLNRMIELSGLSGASAVKIQVFTRSHFPRAERESRRLYEFPRDELKRFVGRANASRLKAGASVFDEHAVDACFEAGCDFLKIASREAYNMPLVHLALDTGLPVYTSFRWGINGPAWMREIATGETPLACIASYPTAEWGGIEQTTRWLGKSWGWSSHTSHYQDVLEAVAAGATVVEKHLALSPDDPEAAWSLLPQQMKEMVDAIKGA